MCLRSLELLCVRDLCVLSLIYIFIQSVILSVPPQAAGYLSYTLTHSDLSPTLVITEGHLLKPLSRLARLSQMSVRRFRHPVTSAAPNPPKSVISCVQFCFRAVRNRLRLSFSHVQSDAGLSFSYCLSHAYLEGLEPPLSED